MGWDTIAELIIEVGYPAAVKIYTNWSSGVPVTPEELAKVDAMLAQRAVDRMKAKLVAAGIPLTDPKAIALLALSQ